MKKTHLLLILCLAFIGLSGSAIAQEPATEKEYTDEEKVNLLCDCVNLLMEDMHPEFRTMIRDMDSIGPDKAGEKFAKYIEENPDEVEKIKEDTKKLDNFDATMASIEGCENLNTILSNTMKTEDSITLEEIENQLNTRSGCEFAAIFFRMGKKQ